MGNVDEMYHCHHELIQEPVVGLARIETELFRGVDWVWVLTLVREVIPHSLPTAVCIQK